MRDVKVKDMVILLLAVSLIFCGCQKKDATSKDQMENSKSWTETVEYEFLEDVDLAWKDNTLDDWQAVINQPIKEVKAEGEQYGGDLRYIACEGGAVRFKNHLVSSYLDCWSGVSGVNLSGEEFSIKPVVDAQRTGTQIDLLGAKSGNESYVACKCELDENNRVKGLWLYHLDKSFETVQSMYADISLSEFPKDVYGDGEGNFHVISHDSEAGSYRYFILSPDGEVIFEAFGGFSKGFREFGGGRVAACEEITENYRCVGQRLLEADFEKGTLSVIGRFDLTTLYQEMNASVTEQGFVTPVSEKEMLWCGKGGIYLCNAEGGDARMAYCFANHGIAPEEIRGAYAKEDGTFLILYKDSDGMNFLLLKPTLEKTEIKTITFAVDSHHKDAYVSAAAYFNKKYPAYNVMIKDDYDETSLLTQLGAGEGPVLVDTTLTGFEELEKLWQPMDGFLEKTGLADELYEEALNFGKIEGRTYGIVTNFCIETLVTMDGNLQGWDYHTFLDAVESFDGAAYAYGSDAADGRYVFFHKFLRNGLDDNAYFELEDGNLNFDVSGFERMLRLSGKARISVPAEDGEAIRSGKALCELYYVTGVQGLVRLRMRRESGEIVNGFPTMNGARHVLQAQNPIAVRVTATEEERQMAYTFLKILLSHDFAETMDHGATSTWFSVRKDALKDEFDRYDRQVAAFQAEGRADYLPELNREKEEKLFVELLRDGTVRKSFPSGLENVFIEEFQDYLNGTINGETLYEQLRNRTWLFLEEQK